VACSKAQYEDLQNHPAFQELMEWVGRAKDEHLRADPPNSILPNYGEVYAARAARYRLVMDIERFIDKRTRENYKAR